MKQTHVFWFDVALFWLFVEKYQLLKLDDYIALWMYIYMGSGPKMVTQMLTVAAKEAGQTANDGVRGNTKQASAPPRMISNGLSQTSHKW
jgi:hypothetical protein